MSGFPGDPPTPLPFPPIERHGVIGDRRTAALVAADGTVDWFCAPDFDGQAIFTRLLDVGGGHCRLGPESVCLGEQSYVLDSATLLTRWRAPNGAEPEFELADVMLWPTEDRPAPLRNQRVMVRRLRALRTASASLHLHLSGALGALRHVQGGIESEVAEGVLGLWSSFPLERCHEDAFAVRLLEEGEEWWCAVGWNLSPSDWSVTLAGRLMEEAGEYWKNWTSGLRMRVSSQRAWRVRRSAITVQLLGHAHTDSVVAAPTTSLPERIGGDLNYDYRYAWVRDASLSLALLAGFDKHNEVVRYLDWLCGLGSETEAPLQVCYRLNGKPAPPEESWEKMSGYRHSLPVRTGNRAVRQRQVGSMGFLANCVGTYLETGGEWRQEFWPLLRRAADYSRLNWQKKDCGIWELVEEEHYVASKVMAWVTLNCVTQIAERTGQNDDTTPWKKAASEIHAEVMERGWCPAKNSFRQRYGSEALDAATLLISLGGFLPADHPRVLGTLDALQRELVVDGLLHRFNPMETLRGNSLPMAEFEGAFLPCVFWHARALAKAGRRGQAESILEKCEAVSGALGLFAEEIDPRAHAFLGNFPLLFSHVEYVRAVMEL